MKEAPEKSWINPKVEVRKSEIEGKGMFAVSPISEGDCVVIFGGEYTNKEEADKAHQASKLVMRWDDDLYSIEERGDDPSYFINHSCDSNLWMDGPFNFIARRNIELGEDITVDYVLFEADEDYTSDWECHCGSSSCRKVITGKDWRLPNLQTMYKDHFSPLIIKRIQSQRS